MGDCENSRAKATKSATTAQLSQEMTSDDMLLQVVEAWPTDFVGEDIRRIDAADLDRMVVEQRQNVL